MTPIFTHDCCACTFAGNIFLHLFSDKPAMVADLYLNCGKGESKFLIRKSDEGSDYITTENLARYLSVS